MHFKVTGLLAGDRGVRPCGAFDAIEDFNLKFNGKRCWAMNNNPFETNSITLSNTARQNDIANDQIDASENEVSSRQDS